MGNHNAGNWVGNVVQFTVLLVGWPGKISPRTCYLGKELMVIKEQVMYLSEGGVF